VRATRPGESHGIIGHAGAYRVEVDVTAAAQRVVVAADEAGLVTTFPQGAGAPVASIELADVLTSEFLHQARHRTDLRWRDEQVDVVVHEHIGVQNDTRVEQGLAQQMQIAPPITVIEEAKQPIVAALDDVLRDVRKSSRGMRAMQRVSPQGLPARQRRMLISRRRSARLPSPDPAEVNLTRFG